MRLVSALIGLCLSFPLMADLEISATQIYDIDLGNGGSEEPLVFLTSGQVIKFSLTDRQMLARFQRAKRNESWLNLTVNQEREILDIETLPAPERDEEQKFFTPLHSKHLPLQFTPSVLGSMDHARKYHRQARRWREGETQCFNRAHVWSYDWWKNNNVYSMKMFIFFTRKYVRKHDFEWWFHIAPYIHVNVDGSIRERMMDMKYTRSPLPVKQWTEIFMRNKADCPVITRYSEYANHPETGDCFLMRKSMFYYQPVDMEMEETWGTVKNSWMDWEVREAYREAFDVSL